MWGASFAVTSPIACRLQSRKLLNPKVIFFVNLPDELRTAVIRVMNSPFGVALRVSHLQGCHDQFGS
jgi:hypothetical protein